MIGRRELASSIQAGDRIVSGLACESMACGRPTWAIAAFVCAELWVVDPCHAERVYRMVDNPAIQNGYLLDGTITTTDDAPFDSPLSEEEILGWDWSLSGNGSYSASSLQYTDDGRIALGVRITPTTIELPLATAENPGLAELQLQRSVPNRGLVGHSIRWNTQYDVALGARNISAAYQLGGDVVIGFWSGEVVVDHASTWVLARAVPEPASVVCVALAVISLLATCRARSSIGRPWAIEW